MLHATTKTVFSMYWPMWAFSQARPQESQPKDAGSAMASPKISVLVLKEARNVHRIGPMMRIAQISSAMWDMAPKTPSGFFRLFGPNRIRSHQNSILSRRVTRRVIAANVMVMKNSATPIADA